MDMTNGNLKIWTGKKQSVGKMVGKDTEATNAVYKDLPKSTQALQEKIHEIIFKRFLTRKINGGR